MSYDFHFFTPREGVDVRDTIESEDGQVARGPRDPKIEAKKRKVADALIARDPQLELFKPDFDEIAKLHKIRVDEAFDRHRHLELNDAAVKTSGIQITFFDESASLTIPYWHKDADARRILEQSWRYIDIICRETGYEVFDPQLDRVIDVNAFDEVLRCYAGATARMEDKLGRAPKKPWWKFW